jgi:hypothetical protein
MEQIYGGEGVDYVLAKCLIKEQRGIEDRTNGLPASPSAILSLFVCSVPVKHAYYRQCCKWQKRGVYVWPKRHPLVFPLRP